MKVTAILRIVLIVWVIIAGVMLAIDMRKHKDNLELGSPRTIKNAIIGFFANFFDTWGIGSFAPSTFAYKTFKSCPDDLIPGTLNVGDTFPVCVEAILFMEFVDIAPLTLVTMLAAAGLGAFIGAGVVSKWNVNRIRIGMGIALVCCAVIFASKLMKIGPFKESNVTVPGEISAALEDDAIDGSKALTVNNLIYKFNVIKEEDVEKNVSADILKRLTVDVPSSDTSVIYKLCEDGSVITVTPTGVSGMKLVVAVIINFFLGSLMMIGFGLYQPCMALIILLGMNLGVAFPVMMGSCAVLMLTSVPKFIQTGKYDKNATLMNAIGGSLGALAAYLTLKYAFDLTTLSYIVCVVMFYTAARMFIDAKNNAS